MPILCIHRWNTKEGQSKVLRASQLCGKPSAEYAHRQAFQHEGPQCERPSDDSFRESSTRKQPFYKKSEGEVLDQQVSSNQVRRKHEKIQFMQDMKKLQLYTHNFANSIVNFLAPFFEFPNSVSWSGIFSAPCLAENMPAADCPLSIFIFSCHSFTLLKMAQMSWN